MIGWVIKTSILSLIFILLVHHLIIFFKDMLTVTKIKNISTRSDNRYKNILSSNINDSNNVINTPILSSTQSYDVKPINKTDSYTDIDLLPTDSSLTSYENINMNMNNETMYNEAINNENSNNMKDELKLFFKKQMNK